MRAVVVIAAAGLVEISMQSWSDGIACPVQAAREHLVDRGADIQVGNPASASDALREETLRSSGMIAADLRR